MFRVLGFGFSILGFRVGFRVLGSRFMVLGLREGFWGWWFRFLRAVFGV